MKRLYQPSTSGADKKNNLSYNTKRSDCKLFEDTLNCEYFNVQVDGCRKNNEEIDHEWNVQRKRLRTNGVNVIWAHLQRLADTDNHRNHIREAILNSNSQYTDTVEDAGVLMAIEEYGLGFSRLDPRFTLANFNNSNSFETLSVDFINQNMISNTGKQESTQDLSFVDYAVNTAIECKGLSPSRINCKH